MINNRVVSILLPGNSIEAYKKYDWDYDFCYASVNDFWIMERDFHKLDLVLCSAKECNVPNDKHLEFMSRDNVMFITEESSFHHDLEETKEKYGDKLFFFTADRTADALKMPSPEKPLNFLAQASFSILIQVCIIGLAKGIILFGADGGGEYYTDWDSNDQQRLMFDTNILNEHMQQLIVNTYRTWKVPPISIINCSLKSNYQMFPRYDYDELRKLLGC